MPGRSPEVDIVGAGPHHRQKTESRQRIKHSGVEARVGAHVDSSRRPGQARHEFILRLVASREECDVTALPERLQRRVVDRINDGEVVGDSKSHGYRLQRYVSCLRHTRQCTDVFVTPGTRRLSVGRSTP